MTGFGFVLLYNKAPARFRQKSFLYIVLPSIVLSFPTFLYFLIIAALSLPIWSLVPFIVAINFGVFLFYLSIGIYHWRISWAIWKAGWYAWNIIPIANFFLIYPSLTGVDVATNALVLFGTYRINGSVIISLIICIIIWLPCWYTWIKKHFAKIILVVWGLNLFLLYWVSQNLFVTNLLLRNSSFIAFSATLLMPLLIIFKFWKIVSIFWVILLTPINTVFLGFYFTSIGLSLEISISIDILIIGLFLIVYSFFPNIRSVGVVLISAYFITLLGIFLTIYFILFSIIQNPIFSINISFIIIGFTLFSSKYMKVPKRIVDLILCWILIINFAWLTFNLLNLFPGLLFLAFSLALTVGGGTFFIFNRYKMKFRINKIIPFLIVALGVSLSVTSLISLIFKASIGILVSTFSSVFIIFLYFIFTEFRYILWFCIPIPITSLILDFMLRIEIIRPFWLITWAMLYLITFQILINMFKGTVEDETSEKKNSIFKLFKDKNQVRWLNFTCFFLNSIFISLFFAIIIPNLLKALLFTEILIVYQICDFLIIWSFLFLFCMKYAEKAKLDLKIKDQLRYFNKISYILYILIPLNLGINLLLSLIFINWDITISTFLFLLTVSGMLFFEVYILDRGYFFLLFNSTRKKFIFGSWFMFCNILSIFLFFISLNVFSPLFSLFLLVLSISLLNLISLYYLSHLDISKQIISTLRLILIYNSLIWCSFFAGSLVSEGLILIFEELRGFGYYTLLFQNSSLLLFIMSFFFGKIEKNIKNLIEFILFAVFQGLLAINLIYISHLFGYLDFFTINLIIFIEVCLSFISVNYLNTIMTEQKYTNFLLKIHSLMVLLLYCEVSLMIYSLLSRHIGIYESSMASLSILFILTLLDIYQIKKIKIGYARLIHTITYFTITVMLFIVLYNNIVQYQFFLGLGIFIFILMQFYTNYSLFSALKEFYPKRKDNLNKMQLIIQRLIGTGFYITICIFLVQGLFLLELEVQLIFLILSLLIHFLMIIDSYVLKFLGQYTNYVKVVSWILIMLFTSTYLIWIFGTFFIAFFITVIPLIVIIFILELAYLFKLLTFWQFVYSNKAKIKFYLITISYLNFITWPLYFATLNLLHILNLVLASFFIMFLITLIDKVLKEKFRKSLRAYSFLIIGGLLSIDTFLLLDLIPNFNIFLNLSISSLLFVFFLAIKVRPFKEHSAIAAVFWLIIFTLLSLIIYFASLNWIAGVTIFSLTCIIYPFVFLLEELRELFNNLVDYLARFFRRLNVVIKNMVIKMINFLKIHIKIIWILLSILISSFIGISLSPLMLNLLNPIHSTLLILPIFGILYSLIPSKKSDDVNVMFRRRLYRLIISWGSIIILLFTFITDIWYVFTVWISVWIIGAILLPYIIFKERSENISIKWRFYTLIILIILLIVLGIIVGIQAYTNFFL
jgi:hypothetical protein